MSPPMCPHRSTVGGSTPPRRENALPYPSCFRYPKFISTRYESRVYIYIRVVRSRLEIGSVSSSSFGIDRKIGSRDSSCGSHPPLLFASGSRYTFDSCNRGIRGRAIALRLLAPSRATPWKTNSGQIDRWICRSTIDSRVDCPTRFPDHVPFFPPSSFRLGRRTSETEKLVSSCVHRRIRLPRGSSSPLLHTVGGRREPIRAENKSSNIRGDFDFPSLSPCFDNISKRKRENRDANNEISRTKRKRKIFSFQIKRSWRSLVEYYRILYFGEYITLL